MGSLETHGEVSPLSRPPDPRQRRGGDPRRRHSLSDVPHRRRHGPVQAPARGGAPRGPCGAGGLHRRARRPLRGGVPRQRRRRFGAAGRHRRDSTATRLGNVDVCRARPRAAGAGGSQLAVRARLRCLAAAGLRPDHRHAARGLGDGARRPDDGRGDHVRRASPCALPVPGGAGGMKSVLPDTVLADDHALEREAAEGLELEIRHAASTAELDLAALASADAIVGQHRVIYDAAVAGQATSCRVLVRAGAGVDNVDLAAWSARGIPVCNVPDYGISEVADHALGLLLTLARGLQVYHRRVETAASAPWLPFPLPPTVRRLRGAQLLLVGLGAVGRAVAKRAIGLEMRVAYFDPQVADAPAGVVRATDLDATLPDADLVSLHAPLTAAPRHLLDARRIALLKPGAPLINTARGRVLDRKALYEGLRSGRVGGAGLDVWEAEPPP